MIYIKYPIDYIGCSKSVITLVDDKIVVANQNLVKITG